MKPTQTDQEAKTQFHSGAIDIVMDFNQIQYKPKTIQNKTIKSVVAQFQVT